MRRGGRRGDRGAGQGDPGRHPGSAAAGTPPDKPYIAIDGTGVPMVGAETTGRAGKAADGRARTHEVELGWGAGVWKALREVFPRDREQSCWWHTGLPKITGT